MTPAAVPASRARTVPLASAAFAILLAAAPAAHAAPITLWAAGSLAGALGTVASDFTAATGTPVTTKFLSSGLLRQQIEAGGRPDLFASADTGNPLQLQREGLAGPVTNFAGNRIVAVARTSLGLTQGTLLQALLDPGVKLGTSTPLADPQGDYDELAFAKADALVPGAKAALDAKALRLVGGPTSEVLPAGVNSLVYYIDTTRQADVFLTYYTSAIAALPLDAGLQEIDLPANLAVAAQYGLTIVNGADPGTAALQDYILSPAGQAVLGSFGFVAPDPVPEPASVAVLGMAVAGLVAARRRGPAKGVGQKT